MSNQEIDDSQLHDVPVGAKKIGMSRSYIEKLPRSTPGIYFFGRRRKINVAELKQWARDQAIKRAAEPKRPRRRKTGQKTASTTKGAA